MIEPLCARGEIICWARRGSRDGPWVKLPAEVWDPSPLAQDRPILRPGELRIINPDYLCRYELREERMRTRQDGRTVITIEERAIVVEEWFEPRFALATDNAPRAYSPARLKRWVRDVYKPV